VEKEDCAYSSSATFLLFFVVVFLPWSAYLASKCAGPLKEENELHGASALI
jgi:hypothetical protein